MSRLKECRFSKGDVVKLLRPGRHRGRMGKVVSLDEDGKSMRIRLLRLQSLLRRWNDSDTVTTHVFCFSIPVLYEEVELLYRRAWHQWAGRSLVKFPCPKNENPKVTIVWPLHGDTIKVHESDGREAYVSKRSLYAPADSAVFVSGDEVLCPIVTDGESVFCGWRRGKVVGATGEGLIEVNLEKIDVTPQLILENAAWKSFEVPVGFYWVGDLRPICENKIGAFLTNDTALEAPIEHYEPLLL